uniref:Large ribosomal subunit protein uL3c n=1 Tax=Mantoniella antarctica TaxID=81844 RepID=A0A7S0XBQ5_9CHLO|mmetsp:Transcript_34311/g.86335  ORF Transcript_34311/g.86335 Transcript_34311/m.86335 type:complete len:281 (+) Transcript_34311:74-916(+)|eukprot:CAMPEP_0181366000 /NCGR_PEP_ID=MMETSP1106-20121128/10423_1 /TAXON_ID=81844 /ORGANISM="Mantoniella antarctica, Strain SL-175" /LENGTH=280 /DNA_ID=CAMNT_0023481225 /DNA_START=209 /DNA_END=1051 /DNA_ORIENTATION=+
MAAIAAFQSLSLAPACTSKPGASAKRLSAGASTGIAGVASLRRPTAVRTSASTARSGGLSVSARFDAGVGVFGNKAGMTQLFTPEGLCVPVTVIAIQAGNVVTQVKTEDTDGYNAVQVGYDQVKDYKITKPEVGHCTKAGALPMRHLEEFRLKGVPAHILGQQLNPSDIFNAGDVVDVRGTSIGKGWQGAVKKYGFARGLMTHGSKSHRQHGSVGAGTTPGRIYPGKKMHSQMGNETTTIRKLKIMRVEEDCIIVRGSVPGKRGNLLRVAPAKIVGKNIF